MMNKLKKTLILFTILMLTGSGVMGMKIRIENCNDKRYLLRLIKLTITEKEWTQIKEDPDFLKKNLLEITKNYKLTKSTIETTIKRMKSWHDISSKFNMKYLVGEYNRNFCDNVSSVVKERFKNVTAARNDQKTPMKFEIEIENVSDINFVNMYLKTPEELEKTETVNYLVADTDAYYINAIAKEEGKFLDEFKLPLKEVTVQNSSSFLSEYKMRLFFQKDEDISFQSEFESISSEEDMFGEFFNMKKEGSYGLKAHSSNAADEELVFFDEYKFDEKQLKNMSFEDQEQIGKLKAAEEKIEEVKGPDVASRENGVDILPELSPEAGLKAVPSAKIAAVSGETSMFNAGGLEVVNAVTIAVQAGGFIYGIVDSYLKRREAVDEYMDAEAAQREKVMLANYNRRSTDSAVVSLNLKPVSSPAADVVYIQHQGVFAGLSFETDVPVSYTGKFKPYSIPISLTYLWYHENALNLDDRENPFSFPFVFRMDYAFGFSSPLLMFDGISVIFGRYEDDKKKTYASLMINGETLFGGKENGSDDSEYTIKTEIPGLEMHLKPQEIKLSEEAGKDNSPMPVPNWVNISFHKHGEGSDKTGEYQNRATVFNFSGGLKLENEGNPQGQAKYCLWRFLFTNWTPHAMFIKFIKSPDTENYLMRNDVTELQTGGRVARIVNPQNDDVTGGDMHNFTFIQIIDEDEPDKSVDSNSIVMQIDGTIGGADAVQLLFGAWNWMNDDGFCPDASVKMLFSEDSDALAKITKYRDAVESDKIKVVEIKFARNSGGECKYFIGTAPEPLSDICTYFDDDRVKFGVTIQDIPPELKEFPKDKLEAATFNIKFEQGYQP